MHHQNYITKVVCVPCQAKKKKGTIVWKRMFVSFMSCLHIMCIIIVCYSLHKTSLSLHFIWKHRSWNGEHEKCMWIIKYYDGVSLNSTRFVCQKHILKIFHFQCVYMRVHFSKNGYHFLSVLCIVEMIMLQKKKCHETKFVFTFHHTFSRWLFMCFVMFFFSLLYVKKAFCMNN